MGTWWFRGFGEDRLWLLANIFKGWGISMIDPGAQERKKKTHIHKHKERGVYLISVT